MQLKELLGYTGQLGIDRDAYIRGLEAADGGDLSLLVNLIAASLPLPRQAAEYAQPMCTCALESSAIKPAFAPPHGFTVGALIGGQLPKQRRPRPVSAAPWA